MLTSYCSRWILQRYPRYKLIFFVSFIPFIGHSVIFLDHNCDGSPTLLSSVILLIGLCFFGMGIGTYYAISFPAVGLSVPQNIRGTARDS